MVVKYRCHLHHGRMNIWLINPYDELPGEGPEGRYACLAKELRKWGIGELGNRGELENFEMSGRNEVVWVSSAFRHRKKSEVSPSAGSLRHAQGLITGSSRGPLAMAKRSEDWRSEKEQNPRVLLIDAPGYQKNVSLGRMWSQWVWGRRVERELKRKVASGELAKPDVILASSPPLEGARAGLRLATFFGAKGIVDFMDDWPATWLQVVPRSSAEIGKLRNWGIWLGQGAGRLLLWPWFRMARWIYSNADAVSAQSQAFAARAKALGFQGEVHVCYLGGARSALACGTDEGGTALVCGPDVGGTALDMEESGTSQAQDRTPGMFHIIYLGGMGRVYDIGTILAAAKMAQDAGMPWQWSLAGTDPEGKWQARAAALGLTHLTFTGYLQAEALQALMASADIGLVPMDPQSKVAVPYKVGDYLGAGLAVVNSLPGELEEMLGSEVGGRPSTGSGSSRDRGRGRGSGDALRPLRHTQGQGQAQGLRETGVGGAGSFYGFKDPQSLFDAIKGYADDAQKLSDAKGAARRLFEEYFNREKTYPAFAAWVRVSCGTADQ